MSLIEIIRGLSGTARDGTKVTLSINDTKINEVTLRPGKYLSVHALEYQLVQSGQTVKVETSDGWSQEYTVPQGRVVVLRWTYEDEEEF
jgi:outer membrane usher protein FimD/PapC